MDSSAASFFESAFSEKPKADLLSIELQRLQNRRSEYQTIKNIAPITGFTFALIGAILTYYFELSSAFVAFGVIYFALSIVILISPLTSYIDAQIDSTKNEIELDSLDSNGIEERAERLFRRHEIELRKYYTQTLSQSTMIFFAGLACMIVGFLIIGYTLYILLDFESQKGTFDDRLLSGVFGLLSGILTNFVGAIFLKMFSSVSDSLNVFHQRLVDTHTEYYNNYLISKIENSDLREKSLNSLALDKGIKHNV